MKTSFNTRLEGLTIAKNIAKNTLLGFNIQAVNHSNMSVLEGKVSQEQKLEALKNELKAEGVQKVLEEIEVAIAVLHPEKK